MMRIAFVYDVPYPWHVGGIESMNYNEAEQLAKDHEVHYFTTRWEGMKGEDFTYHGIHYHAMHKTEQAKIYRHGRRSIREALAYANSLKRMYDYDFDVVITNAFPIVHLPALKKYCKKTKAKLIVEVAEVWDKDYWIKYIGRVAGRLAYPYSVRAMKGADYYITISSTTTKKLEDIGIRRSKISIFAPNLDDSVMGKIRKEKVAKSKLVLFSGRMIKEKRLDRWLIALRSAYIHDNSIRGLIIGKGPEKKAIETMIKEIKMDGRIRVVDFYKDNLELYRKIREACAVLHMSEREGLGIIAIESVALGTPVVLPSDTPIPKEVSDMCVVASESQIPKRLVEIANSKSPEKYIFNRKNLAMYSKSEIRRFYRALFSKLNLR